ncbi:hypothetical protein [Tuwongella immobilis]|uniref:Uncharacterized protein n=1 Tax=Tuwongella immobilis TaxID=692036 RepID=A0A6C2YU56_9BACT|nr:hypothetical protein [Tuwongella immobilis]VIP05278.1 unnamed protein product [Tuwongella immobilis]VTS07912.1 unnamed protein product [Tuwongella immobilis]
MFVGKQLNAADNINNQRYGSLTGAVGHLPHHSATTPTAKSFVTNGFPLGIRITAEVDKLPTGYYNAEVVLRGLVRSDGWNLHQESGAADGTWDEIEEQGYGGWTASHR